MIFAVMACSKKPCDNAVGAKFKDLTGLDGCGMVIELQDGSKIEPINIDEFDVEPVDGKSIWVKYHNIDGGSVCMVGPIVEIDCIKEK